MRASRSASRRLALRLSAFGLVVCVLASCSGEPPEESPPQRSSDERVAESSAPEPPRLIVLISLDTLRPDHLGLYGYPKFTSPVLDTLALEGVVFDDATSTAAWTLPSHASMLTGLFPKTHGVQSSRTKLPAQVPTLGAEGLVSGGRPTRF